MGVDAHRGLGEGLWWRERLHQSFPVAGTLAKIACAGAAAPERVHGLPSSEVARQSHAREDLSALGQVPVAERHARHAGGGRPRAAAQHAVGVTEEDLRVLAVGVRAKARISPEVAGRPLPYLADRAQRARPAPAAVARGELAVASRRL